jgi:5-methylcytosine-specific restriction endonuclease McrA
LKRDVAKVAKEIADIIDRWDGYAAQARTVGSQDIVVQRGTLARWLLVLCPPRTRKILSESVKERRATAKELDALCREVVFLRDGGKCRKCGRSDGLMDWAHVYSRRFRVTRWLPANSMVLCRTHHLWWHQSPTEAIEWWKSQVGPEIARRLEVMKRAAKAGPSRLVKLSLERERNAFL